MSKITKKDEPLATLFDLQGEKELVEACKKGNVHSIFCLKAKRRATLLANHLLNEEGKVHRLVEVAALLEKQGSLLLPEEYNERDISDHFLGVLQKLKTDKGLIVQLQSFGLPFYHPFLEEIVAIALGVQETLTDRHVIWAVLAALLCPLRQSVGSCFATAPAILIHEEQKGQFLTDMQSLLATGQLKRVFGGLEFSVPMSPTPGLGDLKKGYKEHTPSFTAALRTIGLEDKPFVGGSFLEALEQQLLDQFELTKKDLKIHRKRHSPKLEKIETMQRQMQIAKWHFVAFADSLLLKMWEFTLASFADVKTEFSRWNLYSSLGLHPDEKGGIGELIFTYLEEKLKESNEKLAHFQQEYAIAFDQVRATERLLQGASSESEVRRLRAEHMMRLYHMRSCEEMRDAQQVRSKNTAEFFSFLIESYVAKFQEYFQEIYDAEMQEIKGNEYDDSPAGFRLLYKHGRTHVASWTFIHTKEEYIASLKDFFLSVENSLVEMCEWKEGKQEISHLTTAIIHHISGEEFLVTSFNRMAKAHRVSLKKVTLDELDAMEKKPWAYTSGGTIHTLLKIYFRREGSLSEEARWVESPQDLLIFLLETFKMLPPFITDRFIKQPHKRMLATSPTHAFSLLPGQDRFCLGWQDPGFTYTWVRDQLLLPGRHFYESIVLHPFEQLILVQEFAKKLPLLLAHEMQSGFKTGDKSVSIAEFYRKLIPYLPAHFISPLEGFIYEMLPLVSSEQFETSCQELGFKASPLFKPIGRRAFHDLLVTLFLEREGICHSVDVHQQIEQWMEKKRFSPPPPLIFADSNWAKFYFAFLVSPVSNELELWRSDKIGLTALPMKEWASYLDGSVRENWSLFLRPYEYSL